MDDPLERLYRTKLAFLATLLLFAGLTLLIIGHWIQRQLGWQWLGGWPITDIGSGLFTTGFLGVALQYFDGQDGEARATQRLERVLAAATPAMRDAVIEGFAFQPEDLARVATPETLDKIITNGLAMRLGDASFASELYDDLRQQVIDMPERLYDARTSIRLSMDRSTTDSRAPLFITTVRWGFTIVPTYQTRRFVCLSDWDEFRELDQDTGGTSAWYIKPVLGVDAGTKEAFELVQFTVDGDARPIRRTAKQGSQTYSVSLGKAAVDAQRPVAVAYTYRTVTPMDGHLLQLRVDQPTRGLAVEVDYSDTELSRVNVLDYIGNAGRPRISRTPTTVPDRKISVDFEGWVLPRCGCAFVWSS